jgi:hypothetical protein
LTPHRGGAAVIIVTLMALLSAGRFYADLHLADAALLAAAPILMWVGSLMPARWPKLRSVAAVALMVAGIAAAVALAAGRYLAEQSADPYGGYY